MGEEKDTMQDKIVNFEKTFNQEKMEFFQKYEILE